MKKLFLICFCIFSSKTFGQNQDKHINFMVFIDTALITDFAAINHDYFVIYDSNNVPKDTILTNYQGGELLVSNESYKKIFELPDSSKISFFFNYTRTCEDLGWENFNYEISLKVGWIKKRYIVLKVYNFTNKRNWKYFHQRENYGFEVEIPGFSKVLIRKKQPEKIGCN